MRTRQPVPVHNLKVSRTGKVKKRSILWRMRRAFYLAVLALVVGASGLVYVLGQIELPVDPRVASTQDQTSFICASDVQVNCNASNAMAQLHGTEDRVLVTWDQIPQVLRDAVVSAEDRDFFRHGGVDPLGIARAAYRDIRNQGVRQGGSTITQQYVKQEYLTSDQTVTRKIKEAVMAMKLEQEISKEEILTRYLNTVYFGRGAYGVQAASRAWFRRDVSALDAGQAAFLAGLLRNPNGADPYRVEDGTAEAERRRDQVLGAMLEEEYLSPEDHAHLVAVPVDPEDPSVAPRDRFISPPPRASTLGDEVKGSQWGSEYFAEHVRQWLVEEFGTDAVYGGGLKVYTTLDLGMQKAAYETVTSTLGEEGDPAAAITAIDDGGRVRAMMAGTDFEADKFNLVTSSGGIGRQPGSTFKTFALADAVRRDYSVQSVLASPTNVEITDPTCLSGEDHWEVRGGPGGSASLITATKNSINTTFAELMTFLGPQSVADTAVGMGVASMDGVQPYCAWVLGSGEVTVLDMAAGYSTLANEGVAKSPIVVTRVEFPDGEVIDYEPETREVLTPDQAGRVTHSLREVIDGGTGSAADFGRPAAGKTGTTQNNADAWFVGYTPRLTAAVWMGYPQGQVPMDDVRGIRVQGGTFPAEMWRDFMAAATANTDTDEFPELDPEVLAEGETIDPAYGKTNYVGEGLGSEGEVVTTAPPVPVEPVEPVPEPIPDPVPPPETTAPPATAPPAIPPPTSAPPGGGPGPGDPDED